MCSNNTTDLSILTTAQLTGTAITYLLSGILSTALNLIIALIFLTHPSLRSEHNVIVAIAMADGAAGISAIQKAIVGLRPPCLLTLAQCTLHEIPMILHTTWNYGLMFTLSAFRLLGMERPLLFKRLIARRIHLIIYAVLVIYTTTGFLVTYDATRNDHSLVPLCVMATLPLSNALRAVAPILLVLIALTNTRMYLLLRRKLKRGAQPQSDTRKRTQPDANDAPKGTQIDDPIAVKAHRMSNTVIIVSVVYLANTIATAGMFNAVAAWVDAKTSAEVSYAYTGPLLVWGSMANFFVYFGRLSEFREAIMARLRRAKREETRDLPAQKMRRATTVSVTPYRRDA